MNKRIALLSALSIVILIHAAPSPAVNGALTTTVLRTVVTTPNTSGGCLAVLGAALSTAVPPVNCPSNRVTFSCNGTYTSKDLAFYMLDQAQLALSLNKKVYVVVDDTKKLNGTCFASRIEVLK